MKVGLFARPFPPAVGGLERIAELLAREFALLGHDVLVVTDTVGAAVPTSTPRPYAVTEAHSLAERVSAFRGRDVVLLVGLSLHGLAASLLARVPVVASHHGQLGTGVRAAPAEHAKRWATHWVPNICCSRFVASTLPAPAFVVPNAYDDVLFVRPEGTHVDRDFVFCGRLVSDKGADIALRAFARVAREFGGSTLDLVGDGPERTALEQLARELGISDKVRFAGILQGRSLVDELSRHSCLVVPSVVAEGFGLVALEGLACCEGVMVARNGGLPEAVGGCGPVLEPSVNAFAEAMLGVARDRAAHRPLSIAPSDDARERHLGAHTPTTMANSYLAVLERACAGRGQRS